MSIYLIDNIIVPLDSEPDFRRDALKALRCKASDLTEVSVYRRSVDARKKEKIRLNYTLAAKLKDGASIPSCAKVCLLTEEKPQFRPGAEQLQDRNNQSQSVHRDNLQYFAMRDACVVIHR